MRSATVIYTTPAGLFFCSLSTRGFAPTVIQIKLFSFADLRFRAVAGLKNDLCIKDKNPLREFLLNIEIKADTESPDSIVIEG